MSDSNNEGRNQKLVIDYLAALLDDTKLNEQDSSLDNAFAEIDSALDIDDSLVNDSAIEASLEDEPSEEFVIEPEQAAQIDDRELEQLEYNEELAPADIANSDDVELDVKTADALETVSTKVDVELLENASESAQNNESLALQAVELELEPEPEFYPTEDVNFVPEIPVEKEVAVQPAELSINCLIVLMYGLKLAIPFEDIEGMIKLSNVSLSLTSERNWILGDFSSATMGTHVVDTAQILFGDNYDPIKSNYNEMLVLSGKHWSIVFDKVIKAQNILLSDVTENPSPQFRPWLTGTYLAEKCALVNVRAMVKMFDDELNA
jgi:purine-binding chemotaxis protein CheW